MTAKLEYVRGAALRVDRPPTAANEIGPSSGKGEPIGEQVNAAVPIMSAATKSGKPPAFSGSLQLLRFSATKITTGARETFTWHELCARVADLPQYASKDAQPLVAVGMRANDSRAEGTPVVEMTAVVGDYDGHVVPGITIAEGAARLERAGIVAVLHTSARHTDAAPRWRVIAALSGPIHPNEYAAHVDCLNGALGGILDSESWEASRCFYFGRVHDVPFAHAVVDGAMTLDTALLIGECQSVGQPKRLASTSVKPAPEARALDRAIALDEVSDETIEDLRSALAVFSAEDMDRRGFWMDMTLALRSVAQAGHPEVAEELWREVSGKSTLHKPEDIEKYETANPNNITYKSIFTWAEARDWKNPRKATLETQRERSARIGREGEHRSPTQRVMTGTEMLEELVFIADGSRVSFVSEPRFALPINEFKQFTAGSFDEVKAVNSTKVKKVQRTALWIESPERKTVRTQTFAPGQPAMCRSPEDVPAQNLWLPRATDAPADWRDIAAPFFEHVEYLVPIAAERDRFLDWIAHIEQCPGVLPSTHYLLVAKQTGIGRNWLAYALARVFAGYTALGFDLGETLRSGFNGALSQRLLAVVDELHEGGPGGGNKPQAEKLKSLLTEATRRVNPKYGRQHVEFNACRFLMFSNHEAALPLADNDRRVVVLENPSARRDASYYSRLYALLDHPRLGAALAKSFQERDISRFNPGEIAPMNEAKQRTIRAGRSEIEQAVRDVASEWPSDCITAARLSYEIARSLEGRMSSTQGSAVAAGLTKYGRVKVSGEAKHVWIVRNTQRWSQAAPADVAAEVVRGEERMPL